MTVTIREVARWAGVSPMTVSRVVNASPGVRPQTRDAVARVIAATGYVPNALARGLSSSKASSTASSKAGHVGLIIPDVANPFFAPVVRGAESVARRAGYRVILCNSESDLANEGEFISDMLAQGVEGVLIAPVGDGSRNHLRNLDRRGTPYVLIDRSIAGLDCDVVQADSVGGARRLVEHLIGLGHRRIAMITESASVSTARERRRGYTDALEGAGISPLPELVVETSVDLPGGYRAMQQLLHLEPRPSAVFAINNLTAVGAVKAVREGGLRIPSDVALVAFDDIEHVSIMCPFLTVVPQPAETFGTLATQLLLDRIQGRAPERGRLVVLPSELIVRESCGARRPRRRAR